MGFSFFFINLFSMDNFKLWLYVIIGIVYLLSRLLKKRPDESKSQPMPPPKPAPRATPQAPASTPQKSLTFEELLQEIATQKQQKPVPSQPRPVAKYTPQQRVDDEAEDLEDVNYDYRQHDKVYETYEEAKRQAFNRPSLEETMRVEDTVVKFGKFKAFEQATERDLMAEYLKEFQDPEGFRKAFVMSEILQRKF
ncbi:hypothetical protein SAMN04488109_1083 [Chryseolinea serpens]|uniref:Uncharacterized protein n=2 Tax=Chryseolinea serpens TaxID=947013 RepID=A0A1M5L8R4_9BACT|nr:hypothetical protein SAMN04488109_1083 [Chryseolinea serpens]